MNAGLRNFWKWSLLVFLAARSSDVVQSLIGLWLVPKYVPAADVGAILPMTQTVITLSLPLTVLMVPVSRWLAIYTVQGERGKVKSLLRVALPDLCGCSSLVDLRRVFKRLTGLPLREYQKRG